MPLDLERTNVQVKLKRLSWPCTTMSGRHHAADELLNIVTYMSSTVCFEAA